MVKYRIKKETYKGIDGKTITTYYPQHKHFWCPWWHNFGNFDAYTDYIYFYTLEEAEEHIRKHKSMFVKVEYLYGY